MIQALKPRARLVRSVGGREVWLATSGDDRGVGSTAHDAAKNLQMHRLLEQTSRKPNDPKPMG